MHKNFHLKPLRVPEVNKKPQRHKDTKKKLFEFLWLCGEYILPENWTYFNFFEMRLSTENLPLPPTINEAAKPSTKIKYSIPSPA